MRVIMKSGISQRQTQIWDWARAIRGINSWTGRYLRPGDSQMMRVTSAYLTVGKCSPPSTHTHKRRLLWGALLGVGNPWLSFSCSVPRHSWSCTSTRGATPGSCVDAHDKPVPANTRPWPIAGSRLGQRRRRWTSLEPAMGQRIVYAIIVMSPTQTQYTSKVGPLPQTLVKNPNNVSMQLSKEHPYQVIPGVLVLYWANVVIKMGHTGSACTVINLSLIGHSFPTYYRTMHWCTSSLGTDQHLRNITSQPIFTVNHIIKSYHYRYH